MNYDSDPLIVMGSPVVSPRAPRRVLRDSIEERKQIEDDARKIHRKLYDDFKSFALHRASRKVTGDLRGPQISGGRTGSGQWTAELERLAPSDGGRDSRMGKQLRKQLIEELMKKHRRREVRGAATDLEKLRRRRKYEEKQREIRRKKRQRKVISSKVRRKKKIVKVSACPECGDFHYKKSDVCRVRELKVKMIVKQILTHSEDIKENMSIVWKNLELLEETYEQIFLKTHRIQANRVCLGDLTGVDFLGEKHPVNCPCEKRAEKERLDRERMERRRREEDERRMKEEQEVRRQEKQKRLDQQLEVKKKQFYRKMNGTEASSRHKSDSAEKSRLALLREKSSKIIEHFPELRSGRSSLVIIDGELKSLTSEFIEQDGMLIQEQSIHSLDLSELDFENTNEKKEINDDLSKIELEDEEINDTKEDMEATQSQEVSLVENDLKIRAQVEEEKTFDKFLDIMEVF